MIPQRILYSDRNWIRQIEFESDWLMIGWPNNGKKWPRPTVQDELTEYWMNKLDYYLMPICKSDTDWLYAITEEWKIKLRDIITRSKLITK